MTVARSTEPMPSEYTENGTYRGDKKGERIHVISLHGLCPSKKSEKVPTRNKAGKIRMHYQAQPEIDRLGEQIPAELRDLGLLHPDVDIFFGVTHGRADRDGKEATILDLLVKYGVIQGDQISKFNGTVTIHPATRGLVDRVLIKLTDTGVDRWPPVPRKRKPGK